MSDIQSLLGDLQRLRDDMLTNHCEIDAVTIGEAITIIEKGRDLKHLYRVAEEQIVVLRQYLRAIKKECSDDVSLGYHKYIIDMVDEVLGDD